MIPKVYHLGEIYYQHFKVWANVAEANNGAAGCLASGFIQGRPRNAIMRYPDNTDRTGLHEFFFLSVKIFWVSSARHGANGYSQIKLFCPVPGASD